jgi:hypothetical protein
VIRSGESHRLLTEVTVSTPTHDKTALAGSANDPPDALFGPIRAADVFDAMIFVNTLHAAHPNPRR